MTAAPLERNLDVQVRLANGQLALMLGDRAHTLAAPVVWVWHRADGATSAAGIEAAADPGRADDVRAAVAALVEGGFLTPAGPA